MNLFQLYQDTLGTANTTQGGHLRPRTFEGWVNDISMAMFRAGCQQWQTSQQLSDDMRPFFKTLNITVQQIPGKSYGLIKWPVDLEYTCGVRVLVRDGKTFCLKGCSTIDKNGACNAYVDPDEAALASVDTDFVERTVSEIDTQRWGAALEHRTKKPTMLRPIYTIFENGMKVAPKDVSIVVVDYFRLPVMAKFLYTKGTEDQILYDAVNSVDTEWTESLKAEFLKELSTRYGMATRDTEFFQMSKAQ